MKILRSIYPDKFGKASSILDDSTHSNTQKWEKLMAAGYELKIFDPISKETIDRHYGDKQKKKAN